MLIQIFCRRLLATRLQFFHNPVRSMLLRRSESAKVIAPSKSNILEQYYKIDNLNPTLWKLIYDGSAFKVGLKFKITHFVFFGLLGSVIFMAWILEFDEKSKKSLNTLLTTPFFIIPMASMILVVLITGPLHQPRYVERVYKHARNPHKFCYVDVDVFWRSRKPVDFTARQILVPYTYNPLRMMMRCNVKLARKKKYLLDICFTTEGQTGPLKFLVDTCTVDLWPNLETRGPRI